MMLTKIFIVFKLYKKPSLLILLFCFGFVSVLVHLTYSYHLSITPAQFKARESLNLLKKFPEGLVLLSSKPWNENAYNQNEKNQIINWLNSNSKSKTSIKFKENKLIINKAIDEDFVFASLLQKTLYIPDQEIQLISSDFKNNFIIFTLGKYN